MDQQALAEYRYRAVCEVLGGSPIGEVAARYGTSRQSMHTWRKRFEHEGRPGLEDRSRRPRTSPSRVPPEVDAVICRFRREHPRWGARRINYELARYGVDPVPSWATVHRVLARNGLITAQEQQHQRTYKRWQRQTPMHLWQMDIVGGLPLADGRECKLVTGIDDHSRFVVIATVLGAPSGRKMCAAFTAAMRRYGVPSEVLTDNGAQFTGRHNTPQPVEVLLKRICRENSIRQRRTKPRSPPRPAKLNGCSAPRGAWLYPRCSREELERRFLGPIAYLEPKGEGDKSMPGNQRPGPDVRDGALGEPRDRAKAGLPESQSPGDGSSHPPERHPMPVPALRCLVVIGRRNLRGQERCPVREFKEMGGTPTSRYDV
jgi:transposase